jgi:hypothetical protein
MAETGQDVEMWEGDSLTISIAVTQADGSFVSLVGATARWWMGKHPRAEGSNIYIQKSSPSDGVTVDTGGTPHGLVVTILPADTIGLRKGTHYHEAEVTDALGRVSKVAIGAFKLNPSIITPG